MATGRQLCSLLGKLLTGIPGVQRMLAAHLLRHSRHAPVSMRAAGLALWLASSTKFELKERNEFLFLFLNPEAPTIVSLYSRDASDTSDYSLYRVSTTIQYTYNHECMLISENYVHIIIIIAHCTLHIAQALPCDAKLGLLCGASHYYSKPVQFLLDVSGR